MYVDHRPCITDEEVNARIFADRSGIVEMKRRGYPIRTMAAWQSPVTFECHMMPIFESDTWQDVCNRYFDLFPKEVKGVASEIADHKQLLKKNGFSHDKTLLLMGRIPKGLEKFLDCWHREGDFWADKKLRTAFFNYFTHFKVAQPYGSSISVGRNSLN